MSADEERVLLVEGANMVGIGLAKDLLEGAGIPFVVEGPDFDVAELGRAAHDMIRGQSLYVPRSAFDEAKAILDEAWSEGDVELDEDFDVGPLVEEPSHTAPPTRSSQGPVLLMLIGLVLVLGYLLWDARSTVAMAQRGDPLFLYHFDEDLVTSIWASTGQLAQETFDEDLNGTAERVMWYDRGGLKAAEGRDADQNGIWELTQLFDANGRLYQESHDRDQDGRVDRAVEYRRSGVDIEWLDENRDGSYERRRVYDADGQLLRAEEDREGEGWLRVEP